MARLILDPQRWRMHLPSTCSVHLWPASPRLSCLTGHCFSAWNVCSRLTFSLSSEFGPLPPFSLLFLFFLLLFTNFTFLPTPALPSSNTASKNLFCCCSDPVSTNFFLLNFHALYCFCLLFLYFITPSIEKKRREGKLDLIFRVDQMSACNTSSGGSQSPWGCSQDLTESLPSIIKYSPASLWGKCLTLW